MLYFCLMVVSLVKSSFLLVVDSLAFGCKVWKDGRTSAISCRNVRFADLMGSRRCHHLCTGTSTNIQRDERFAKGGFKK